MKQLITVCSSGLCALAVALLGACAGPLEAQSAWAVPATFAGRVVLRDCEATGAPPPIVVRPVHIGCGAVGAPDFTRLRWQGWGGARASATGLLTYRDCPGVPETGCADPRNYHTVQVRLTVEQIETCDSRRAYTRLVARFRRVDGVIDGYHLDLAQAWRACRPGSTDRTPRSFRSCGPAPALIGRLQARGMTCATARRLSTDYFSFTPPGEHVGPAHVDGFSCTGSTVMAGRDKVLFHIACHRGSARSNFLGIG